MRRYVLAITGATGPVLGLRVLRGLAEAGACVHVLISGQSFSIIYDETGLDFGGDSEEDVRVKLSEFAGSDDIFFHGEGNFEAPVASGSFKTDGMLVVPCSMKTLAGIAHGYANTLIERAADVIIKEGRPLIVSPRETPFSQIHLENMLSLAKLGVRVVPPVIGFYQKPQDLDGMIDFLSGRILDSLGVEHNLYRRWGE